MDKQNPNNKFNKPRPPKGFTPKKSNKNQNNNWIFWALTVFFMLIFFSQSDPLVTKPTEEITYSQFYSMLLTNKDTGIIEKAALIENATENSIRGKLKGGKDFVLTIPSKDQTLLDLLKTNVDDFSVKPPNMVWGQLIGLIPFIILFGFLWFVSQRGAQVGNKIWSFGKSKAKMNNKSNITFKDVAGVDEAKEELQEVIEFLKDPKRFEKLGGKIPKGVLLIGPPGTGKTLLAKAVAGEASVPFFSLSGSDFVEMFVGVGASRVRDLFEQGRKASQVSGKGAIIFIDEIDAVGRQRFAGIGGGNDEREQTLNALLVEMDGFNTHSGLILIAATNRPDTLDPALLRPGRFDRQVVVGLPDIIGREGILKVHSKNITLSKDVDFKKIAQQTVYFSGADLANVCNEAALLAARKNKDSVTMDEFYAAVERVTMGPEKKSRVISKKEKEITAFHEAGHALISFLLDEVDTFSKVSIIPRGMAGGYTLTPPTEDKHYLNKDELFGQMTVLLGGLVGEEIHTKQNSTGVSNDLQRCTKIARNMVCIYGMSEKLGPVTFGEQDHMGFLGRDLMRQKDFSEATAKLIDDEVQALVMSAYARAKRLLISNLDKLDDMANYLIEREVIDIDTAKKLFKIEEKLPESTENIKEERQNDNKNNKENKA